MYSQITRNKRKTWLLIALFSVLIVGIGFALGMQMQNPQFGIVIAVIIATVMTLVGYYRGDRVALAASGAKPIEKRDDPELYRLVENLVIGNGLPMPNLRELGCSLP